jgi:hypothetical protein
MDDPIDQGDILEGCPISWIAGFDINHWESLETVSSPERIVVLTQTCDLANHKMTVVTAAVLRDAKSLVDQHIFKATDIKGPIRAGRVFGWYFLPKSLELGLPESIVDLHQLHTVRLDLLTALC